VRRMRSAPSVALLAVLAGACHRAPEEQVGVGAIEGGGPVSAPAHGPSDAGGASVSAREDAGRADVRDFCTDAFSADHERLRSTCSPADLNVSESVARAAGRLCTGDLTTALSRARASFSAEAAHQCVEMLREKPLTAVSAADSLFSHTPCDRVVAGGQAEGSPCRYSIECKDGLACVGYAPGSDGTCKRPPRVGESCSAQQFATILNGPAAALHHPACAHGAWCDGSTCRAKQPSGGACTTNDGCTDGSICAGAKCAAPGRVGGPCAKSADCLFRLWCDKTGAEGTGRCAEKLKEGQSCADPSACMGVCDIPPGDAGPDKHGACVSVCGSG
jgi:hypothetical protein